MEATKVKIVSRNYKRFSGVVQCTITADDKLSRQLFDFVIVDCTVLLNRYRTQTRKSKRHAWVIDKFWDRLDMRSNNADYPNNIPWKTAVAKFREEIVFGIPEENWKGNHD